jgi:hypothetical protein
MRTGVKVDAKSRGAMVGKFPAWVLVAAFIAIGLPSAAHARQVDPWDGGWHYTISPYAWLPGIDANLRFQVEGTPVLSQSTGDIWDNLGGAFELMGSARKGRWGVYGDLDWVDFGGMQGRATSVGRSGVPVEFGDRWDMQGAMANIDGIYTLAHERAGYADLLFGMRFVWIEGSFAWNFAAGGNAIDFARSGSRSRSAHFVNPVIGLRGRWMPFHGRFFVPYHLDYGAEGSTSSGQASVGAGLAFGWGDVALTWRQVWLSQHADSSILKKATLSGPSLRLAWHF